MAESQFVLTNAGDSKGVTLGNISLSAATLAAAAGPLNATDQTGGLRQALLMASGKISLLTTAIDALNVTLAALRSLSLAPGAGAKSESSGARKTEEKTSANAELPATRKSALAMDTAAAALSSVAGISRKDGKDVAQSSLIMASAPLVAAGGTTGVDLVNVASVAAKAGIASQYANASDKKLELLTFANDVAITAAAFKLPATEVAEMTKVWRTSMKLTRDQAVDLADAVNHLGKLPGDVQSADIGAVLQQSGESAVAAGLQPEKAAALSAALLNTGTKKEDAGAALKNISDALAKGEQASAAEAAAWQQLKLDPKAVAQALRNTDNQGSQQGAVLTVLAALNAKPVEQRTALARTLFADSGNAALALSQNLGQVNEAFFQVADKRQYATSALGENASVKASALALANTQQGQLNIKNAREERLSVAKGNALAPGIEKPGDAHSTDKLSELAETYPKTTAAVLTAAEWAKPVFDFVLESVADQLKERLGKGIVDKAASRIPDRWKPAGSAGAAVNPLTQGASPVNANRGSGASNGLKIIEQARWPDAPRLSVAAAEMRPVSRMMPWPVKAAIGATDVIEGVASGDKRKMASGLGAAGGGWAGAAAGSAMGASIGSIGLAPGMVVGGLIGGLIGGWLGSEGGSWLGEKLVAPTPDKLAAPEKVSKELTTAQPAAQPLTFAPTVQVYCSDPGSSDKIGLLVAQHLQNQFMQITPLLTNNSLATRRDAALTDGVAT